MFNLGYGEVLLLGATIAIVVGPEHMKECASAARDFVDRVQRSLLPLSFEQTLLLSVFILGLILSLLVAALR